MKRRWFRPPLLNFFIGFDRSSPPSSSLLVCGATFFGGGERKKKERKVLIAAFVVLRVGVAEGAKKWKPASLSLSYLETSCPFFYGHAVLLIAAPPTLQSWDFLGVVDTMGIFSIF